MDKTILSFFLFLSGFVSGLLLAWVAIKGRRGQTSPLEQGLEARLDELQELRVREAQTATSLRHWQETSTALREELEAERTRREALQTSEGLLKSELSTLSARYADHQAAAADKIALLMEARDSLSLQFKSLANEILEEKSQRFSQQNQAELGLLLDPLKQKIAEFQTKVDDVYVKEGKDRVALVEQVRLLMDLNQTLSRDARNLTQALTGSSKTQGNWGEMLLEKVLEESGLRKGADYVLQESHTREDGSRAQPDVVIHLPDNRHLVIDAKVSLTAYVECANAENDSLRQLASRRHLDSVRGHVRELSQKGYQSLYSLNSIDFALMFVPVEPAFMLAITSDPLLFSEAWEKNILLVSPSTLLFVLRTVSHLWRQEEQSRNAREIARRGAELYNKLTAFVEDLEKVGERLEQAKASYEGAWNKLSRSRGNVIRQAELLRDLGVRPTKFLPDSALGRSDDPDES